MKSPDNNISEAILETKISVEEIKKAYKENFKIDVQKYFTNLKHIDIYKCNETGYRFYHPFTISGDSQLYIELQKFDWYYMPWKWEHETSLSLIKSGDRVLEIGCGQGSFLKKIHELKKTSCVGLELNETTIINTDSLKIENITIEDYSSQNSDQFDIVCSFQVLEHIANVNSFMKGQVACLKKGGALVVCVPNNESFLFKSKRNYLNLPPHHMGLWNENSLTSLQNYFDIKLTKILYGPLESYHFDWYIYLKLNRYVGEFLGKIIFKFIKLTTVNKYVYKHLAKKANLIKGHSIMAIYEKTVVE